MQITTSLSKALVACLLLVIGTSPSVGAIVPTFEYLERDKAQFVRKSTPVKTFKKSKVSANRVSVSNSNSRVVVRSRTHSLSGKASYYWQPQPTANGEVFKPDGISCAHKTLPFNTRIRVTNLLNGKSVVCRVNDRGPFIAGRVVDLSRGAARVIDMTKQGVVPVSIQVVN